MAVAEISVGRSLLFTRLNTCVHGSDSISPHYRHERNYVAIDMKTVTDFRAKLE